MNEQEKEILRHPGFDVEAIRRDFPYLEDKNPVIYLEIGRAHV